MGYFRDASAGLWMQAGVCVDLAIVGALMIHFWPKTPMGRRFFLAAPDEDATMAFLPENIELEDLRGQFGQALSALRPAGVVDFNGRRIDCMTEGIMVERGQRVRCIDVKS